MLFIKPIVLYFFIKLFYFVFSFYRDIFFGILYYIVIYYHIFLKIYEFCFYHFDWSELSFSFFNYEPIFFNFTKLNIHQNIILSYLNFVTQVFFVVIITIWTRAAGPRFRLDQLVNITWKDIFLYLSLFLFTLIIIMNLI